MTTQLLIYESAVPVSKARHGKLSIEAGADYAFARNINSVPLTAVEFLPAAGEYAIVFAGEGEAVMPAVILGMRDSENLYLSEAGTWQSKYLPAFVRRYPFVFSSNDQGNTFTLCIDESFRGFNQEGRGQRLFDDEGKPTPYVDNVLKFLQQYQLEFRRTESFCRKLKELNLLEPMQAQLDTQSGQRVSLTGFMAVNRAKLKALSAETLAELVKSDELELVYAHLHSMRHFNTLRDRMAESGAPAAKEAAAPAAGDRAQPAAKAAESAGGKGRSAGRESAVADAKAAEAAKERAPGKKK